MADTEPEVKIVERSEVEPAEDDAEETPDLESSQDESEGEAEPEKEPVKPEEIVSRKPAEQIPAVDKTDDVKRLSDETDREYALRVQVTNLRRQLRHDRNGDIFTPPKQTETELSPDKKKILERYKPEEVQQVEELFGVIAEKQGYVKKDQLGAQTFADKANDELSKFLDDHQEYTPEHDPESILWDAFKEEFNLYKQPSNPKDFRKIFNKVHETVFGIKKAGPTDTKKTAAQEKIKVASHAGTSSPAASQAKAKSPAGLRLDMLKGFDSDFIQDLENGG